MAIKVSGTEVISDDKRILNNEDLPDIRPSLLLDFANSKTLDPRITFTRGSTATYYDGKTTAKAEENLLPRSQEFNNGQWAKTRVNVTANATTAPDGTTTADAINQASGETTIGRVFKSNATNTAGVTTVSIYAKANTRNFLTINTHDFIDTGFNYTWFNLSTGAVGTTFSGHTASITDVGNGWYRCSITFTSVAAGSSPDIGFGIADTDGTTTVTDDQKGIYVWGAQLEQRSSATAYTPTTSSPIVKYQPVLQTAASGEARFDHDPVTGESKGLLIEEARTNLETNSVYSGNNNVIITTDATIAPDGTQTGILIQENTSNALHRGYGTSQLPTASTRYTFSVYIKNYEGSPNERYFYLNLGSTIGTALGVDLSTMTINTMTGTGSPVSSLEEVGNGWYRLVLTGTSPASPISNNVWYTFRDTTGTGDQTYTGDGFSGFYIWGAQFEQGSFPTSYIPTSGSTVTRAADSAEMQNNVANLLPLTGFTLFAEAEVNRAVDVAGTGVLLVTDTVNSASGDVNTFGIFLRASSVLGITGRLTGSSTQYDFSAPQPTIAQPFKIANAVSTNDVAVVSSTNNTLLTDSSVQMPSTALDSVDIGHYGNQGYLGGHIRKVAIYPKRLPNATLQAMTEE